MDNCIFCRIIRGEIPSKTVFENEHFKVMLDIGPASRGHLIFSILGSFGWFPRPRNSFICS